MATPLSCHTVRAKPTILPSQTSPLPPGLVKLRRVPPRVGKELPSTTGCSKLSMNWEQTQCTRGILLIRGGAESQKRFEWLKGSRLRRPRVEWILETYRRRVH